MDTKIKSRESIGIILATLALATCAMNVSAHEITRDQVRQELIESIDNGTRFVTDTSYPEVSPMYAHEVAKLRSANQAAVATNTHGDVDAGQQDDAPEPCVGPASFCNIYFGG